METRTTKQTMSRTHTVVPSPIGPLTVVAEGGALVRLAMSPPGRFVDAEIGERSEDGFDEVVVQLGEYFAGERTAFELPLARDEGDAFQRTVWELIDRIPYGRTATYGDLARELGEPGMAREVGAAVGSNPLAIVRPCHRVVGKDGRLVGYAGGLRRKQFLLSLETGRADRPSDRLF